MHLLFLLILRIALLSGLCCSAVNRTEPVSSVFEAFGHYRACIANALTSCEFSSKKDFSVDVAESIAAIKSLLQEMKSEHEYEMSNSVAVREDLGNGTYSLPNIRKILQELNSERGGLTNKNENWGRNFENITDFLSDIKDILREVQLETKNEMKHNNAIWDNLENITYSLFKLETTLHEGSGDSRKYPVSFESPKVSLAEVQTTTLKLDGMSKETKSNSCPSLPCNCKTASETPVALPVNKIKNCEDIRQSEINSTDTNSTSGVRTVYPYAHLPDKPVKVYCDQTIDGGGWTVIQNRDALDERENFQRTWKEYVKGFGDFNGEFWLGLDHIHALTTSAQMELRIDLEDWEGQKKWAKYGLFYVGHPRSKFALTISSYTGDAGDSMWRTSDSYGTSNLDTMKFSTFDQDNDLAGHNCAQQYRGAWWFRSCHYADLNGFQYVGKHSTAWEGINWNTFRGSSYSLKKASMKIRPVKL